MATEILTPAHHLNTYTEHGQMAYGRSGYGDDFLAQFRDGKPSEYADIDPSSFGPAPDERIPPSTEFQQWNCRFVPGGNTNENATATAHSSPAQNLQTLSPSRAQWNTDASSPQWNATFPIDSHAHSARSPHSHILKTEDRRDSLYPKEEESRPKTSQPPVGRRRRSEVAAPGSARAIYLEKNRKAASKCRSKQKMEQELLVEKAREVERRNRVLKAEVELLQGELRGIKELVGQHANCPDSRIGQYLDREADRLAAAAAMRPSF